jgi:hypothetical protein
VIALNPSKVLFTPSSISTNCLAGGFIQVLRVG